MESKAGGSKQAHPPAYARAGECIGVVGDKLRAITKVKVYTFTHSQTVASRAAGAGGVLMSPPSETRHRSDPRRAAGALCARAHRRAV
ncbi:hypothetical protein EVAR_14985_1 [Eumeta japonica]|uniref:Uncharacterized protein n=1 Tax=Eumeta variegata TaxID=151549 RepID=A0A4C1X9G0_EUMVA|nr:hypothetical protein EVAR_14985_1 [Eumeta japonica]